MSRPAGPTLRSIARDWTTADQSAREASPPAREQSADQIELGAGLHAGSLLDLHYQPIVHLRTGNVLSYEVLSRPLDERFASPRELIDALTRAGLIGEFGRYVRRRCVAECPGFALSINVEPNEFDEALLVRPDDPMFTHRHPVFLEITESVPIGLFEQCHPILEELRRRGIRLVVDDLGAGFSNLKYISELRPAVVKVDRKLIGAVTLASRDFRLLRSIVRLVHEMESLVVAEGIESSEDLYAAREAGVDYGQGFLLGRPAPTPQPIPWPID
ncbi:MAG TPA: EAL domain-containing protein [Thermoanaerobaculia bacterium]|nr:EAL domain-containing protein [Thermoanaerobaculia bacterium]